MKKIVLYSDKNGKITNKKQRTIFNVVDMIICGEKEGLFSHYQKKVGYLIAGFNQLNMDKAISNIIGFDENKIKYIKNGYELKKYKISDDKKFIVWKKEKKINPKELNKNFKASDGWKDYLN